MNLAILNTAVQEFIDSNLNSDITKLILKGSPFKNIPIKDLVVQIEAKKKCKSKLPTWFLTKNIYFPYKLNIEQTSSEITAKYKASLISGESLIDLTGGFGVDSYYFNKRFKNLTYCEFNKGLSEIVCHNFKQFKGCNIKSVSGDSLEYLKVSAKKFDWVYIDPSRRHETKGKVFFLKDCLPNVPNNLQLLFEHSNNILIKISPLLDISIGLEELQNVKSIHIVSVNNEVKELLWVLEKDFVNEVNIYTVNITKTKSDTFSFVLNSEFNKTINYSEPLKYLYEPNVAVLKSGAFKSIASYYKINKLHKHSHLYTSEVLIEDFPGRSFIIRSILYYKKSNIKSLKLMKANITTRNFPESVEQIRKKFKIKDGGHIYMFFTTNINNEKIVIVCLQDLSS